MSYRSLRTLSVLMLLPVVGACATLRGGDDGPARPGVRVRVENDLIPPTTLSIFAVPEIGARRRLGVVRPSRSTTLLFENATPDVYRFVAQTTAGQEIVSPNITLTPGDGAVWKLSNNIIVPM